MRDFRREANQKMPGKQFLPAPVFLKSLLARAQTIRDANNTCATN
jgi:hypothetical protein